MGRGNKSNPRNEEEFEEQEGEQDQYYTDNKPRSLEWVVENKNCLDEGLTYDSGRSWTIYRVPNNLCEVHKNAFQPKMVSIGPFHYLDREEKLQLQVMEEHKMRFLSDDCEGEEDDNGGWMASAVLLDDLVKTIQKLEEKMRACYSESFDEINSYEFVQMMVVDGCFLVELLCLYHDHVCTETVEMQNKAGPWSLHNIMPVYVTTTLINHQSDEYSSITFHWNGKWDDPIFTTPWMLRTLQRDLLMLENQLPFFVLMKLYELINNNIDQQAVLQEVLAVTFFDPLLPRDNAASKLNTTKPYTHLLDVIRSTFLQSTQWNPDGSVSALVRERQLIHFVSELKEAGVRFNKRKGHDLLDINFAHGTLQTPPLSMDDNTVPLFLNFVADEQCHDHAKPFTNYFMFSDSLVNSLGDIQILHTHRIINHVLGSNGDVANLLNKLCREIVYDLDQCYLPNKMKVVNDYCKPHDESKYLHGHASLFAAIILLLLTLLQTLYYVYPYYWPR
ncbi:hypothetical protein BT93_F2707 [Corymbia citriodora subsp. variegata]|nr:hypothetical protein BT93_F2707 [Corymbia citriodora subsp. variegata]